MASDAEAAQVPVIVTIDGTAYKLAPLLALDWGEVEARMQAKVMRLAEGSAARAATPAEKDRIIEIGLRRAASVSIALTANIELAVPPALWRKLESPFREQLTSLISRASSIVNEDAKESSRLASSPDVNCYILWRSLLRHQPKLTLEDAADLLDKCDDSAALMNRIMWLSGRRGGQEEGGPPKKADAGSASPT